MYNNQCYNENKISYVIKTRVQKNRGKKKLEHAQWRQRVRESWRAKLCSFSLPVLFARCGCRDFGNVFTSNCWSSRVIRIRQNFQFHDSLSRNNGNNGFTVSKRNVIVIDEHLRSIVSKRSLRSMNTTQIEYIHVKYMYKIKWSLVTHW